MAGYAVGTLNNSQPMGLDVSNALIPVRDPSPADLYVKYPQSSGPSRIVNPQAPSGGIPGVIVRAAGFPISFTSTPATVPVAVTWATAGDIVLWATLHSFGVADTISSVTATKAWFTRVGDFTDPTGFYISIWMGATLASGVDTITHTWTALPQSTFTIVDEITAWSPNQASAAIASGGLHNLSTSILCPSLTSDPTAPLQMYWGVVQAGASGMSVGSTPGFTYTILGGFYMVILNPLLTVSTAYQPTASIATSQHSMTAGVIASMVSGSLSNPEYSGAASGLGGGAGSWVNPANANGAPDSVYATWTAP